MSITKNKYNLDFMNKDDYFEQILPDIRRNLERNEKFVDKDFPTDMSSIFNKKNPLIKYFYNGKNEYEDIFGEEKMKKYNEAYEERKKRIEGKKLKWVRLSEFINPLEFFSKDEVPIVQGFLGDCYLISFLRGLQIFQTKKYLALFGPCFPEIGYYEIYFFIKKGEEVKNIKVFVDDYILAYMDNVPLFAKLKEKDKCTLGRSLLIEKALAKMNGCYFNITGQFKVFNNAASTLTCYDYQSLLENGVFPDNIFDIMEKKIECNSVVTLGTKKEEKDIKLSGIEKCHSYLLLQTERKELNHYNKENSTDSDLLKIININNPWGYNKKEKMKNFKLNLSESNKKIEEDIINYNLKNCNTGDMKIIDKNLQDNFFKVLCCDFKGKQKEKEEKKEDIKDDQPPRLPPIDDGGITELYKERISFLDAIDIPKADQEKFFEKYKNNLDEGLYDLFIAFSKNGTSVNTFNQFMGFYLQQNTQNSLRSRLRFYHPQNTQNSQSSSLSSLFGSFISYLNPFSYFNNK